MAEDFSRLLAPGEPALPAGAPSTSEDFSRLLTPASSGAVSPTPATEMTLTKFVTPKPAEKSPLDRAIGQAAARLGERAKGLVSMPGAAATALTGLLSPDPVVQELSKQHRQAFGEAAGGALDILSDDPEKARTATGTLLFGPEWGKAAGSQSLSPLLENPGAAAVDLLLGAPQIGIPAAGAALSVSSKLAPVVRRLPGGATVARSLEVATSKVIPRWMYPDEMKLSDVRRQGEVFHKTVTKTGPSVGAAAEIEQFADLVQTGIPTPATHYLAPKLELSKRELVGFRKALVNMGHQQPGVTALPMTVPGGPAFTYRGRNLHLTVDDQGFITYGHAEDLRALPPDIQTKIGNIRQVIDTNHALLVNRGILSPEDATKHSLDYIHRTYNVFTDPQWAQKVLNEPAYQGVRDRARAYLAKHLNSTLHPGAKASPTEIEAMIYQIVNNTEEVKLNADKLFNLPKFGPDMKAMRKRVSIPPPIEALLGPTGLKGAEFGTAEAVGQTIDMQIRILANDAMMERMTGINAFDGRKLVIPKVSGGGPPYADFVPLENTPHFGRFAGSWVHPDVEDSVRTMVGNSMTGIFRDYISAWKAGKVTWNVPTHINNIISDNMFSILVGHSPSNPKNWPNFTEAAKDMFRFYNDPSEVARLPLLNEAILDGAVVPGFASREIANIYGHLSTSATGPVDATVRFMTHSPPARFFAAMYDAEDQYYRYAAYIGLRKRGLSRDQTTLEIANTFPNYETSSKLGAFLRGQDTLKVGKSRIPSSIGGLTGGPFVSFPLEATRILAHAASHHPFRLLTASSVPLGMTVLGAGMNGMTLADYHSFLKELPEYERGKAWVPIPYGEKGNTYWLDVSPGFWPAQWMNSSETLSDLVGRTMPQGPFNDLVVGGVPLALFEVYKNIDTRTGKMVWDPDRGDDWADLMIRMVSKLAPVPAMLEKSVRNTRAALQGTTTTRYEAEPPSVATGLGQAVSPFRVRTSEELEAAGEGTRRGKLSELRRTKRGIGRDPRLTDEEKETKRERIQQRREDIRERKR